MTTAGRGEMGQDDDPYIYRFLRFQSLHTSYFDFVPRQVGTALLPTRNAEFSNMSILCQEKWKILFQGSFWMLTSRFRLWAGLMAGTQ